MMQMHVLTTVSSAVLSASGKDEKRNRHGKDWEAREVDTCEAIKLQFSMCRKTFNFHSERAETDSTTIVHPAPSSLPVTASRQD